jgi:hypothetical protein
MALLLTFHDSLASLHDSQLTIHVSLLRAVLFYLEKEY